MKKLHHALLALLAIIPAIASGVDVNNFNVLDQPPAYKTQAANSVLGNGTGAIAVPNALLVPSCSAAASALTWTTNTGFGCNTIASGDPNFKGQAAAPTVTATGTNSLAAGSGAIVGASSTDGIAIGTSATIDAGTTQAIVIGKSARTFAGSNNAIAIGNIAQTGSAACVECVSIGHLAGNQGTQSGVSIGPNSGNGTTTTYGIAIGESSNVASGVASGVAIGKAATVNTSSQVAIGLNSVGQVSSAASISIGSSAGAGGTGANSISIGTNSNARAAGAIGLGNVAQAVPATAIAIGDNSTVGASATSGIAIGTSSIVNASATDGIAMGDTASIAASVTRGIAIGRVATIGTAGNGCVSQIVIGSSATGCGGSSNSEGLGIVIGASAIGLGGQDVVIGYSAQDNAIGSDSYNVIIGPSSSGAAGSDTGVAIGRGAAIAGTSGVAIGANASAATNSLDIRWGGADRITGDSSGNVALKANLTVASIASSGAAQTGYLCYNTTGGVITYDGGATCLVSREEYKTNLGPIDNALETVMLLRPFWGAYREGTPMADHHVQPFLGARYTAAVDPRLTSFDKEEQPLGVRYDNITAVLTAAIQQQQAQIEELRKQVQELRSMQYTKAN